MISKGELSKRMTWPGARSVAGTSVGVSMVGSKFTGVRKPPSSNGCSKSSSSISSSNFMT